MKLRSIVLVILMFVVSIGWSQSENPEAADESTPEVEKPQDTDTGPFHVNGYFGTAVDNFAAQDLKDYLNPEDSGQTSAFERAIFGVDFRFDMGSHFSVFGKTLHGVRSTDVDCEKNPDLCTELSVEPTTDKTLFILKSASSLEAFAGLRFDLAKVNNGVVFISGQLGFVTVSDSGQDVMDNHRLGVGVRLVEGIFRDSFLEFGYGRSQFFQVNPNKRFKIDGTLNVHMTDTTSFFLEMRVDSDFSDGADSIQSFYGITFDFAQFFRKKLGNKKEPAPAEGDETNQPR